MVKQKITYNGVDLEFIHLKNVRKTISATVYPNCMVEISTPNDVSQEKLTSFVRKKFDWINKQIVFFSKFNDAKYQKEYISGESFLYLGRNYTLKILEHQLQDKVCFDKGKIILNTTKSSSNVEHNKKLIKKWYEERTNKIFNERYKSVCKNFNYKKFPKLHIRKMEKRWGSYVSDKKIYLNPKLIMASKDCIDYVIYHELCHMIYKNHGNYFYKLLESKCPNWKRLKEKLEYRFAK